MANKEQHLLRVLGLNKGIIRQPRTAANRSTVIPLNGVSRVRIPPPPLPKPPICRTNARASKRTGESSDPVDTTFDTDATRKVFSITSWRVGHGAVRWTAQQGSGIRYPQGMGTMVHPPLAQPRPPPTPNTAMNRLSITRFGVFCTFPSHQNPRGADYKVWDVGATPLCLVPLQRGGLLVGQAAGLHTPKLELVCQVF